MNERIRKLAEQANELDYETFDEYNHKTVQHYKFNKEKFAELIVRECAKIADIADESKCEWIGGNILIHFGVEERTPSQKMADAGYTRRPKGWTKEGEE